MFLSSETQTSSKLRVRPKIDFKQLVGLIHL
jgi:hypothetical protein